MFNPPIAITPDPAQQNQDSAVNCIVIFLTRLSKSDVAGAAAGIADPEETAKQYSDYRQRAGEAEFSKQMAALFNDDHYHFEVAKGDKHVLVEEKTPDGGQGVVAKDGKFWMASLRDVHKSPDFQSLFKLVSDHAAGKLEFK